MNTVFGEFPRKCLKIFAAIKIASRVHIVNNTLYHGVDKHYHHQTTMMGGFKWQAIRQSNKFYSRKLKQKHDSNSDR